MEWKFDHDQEITTAVKSDCQVASQANTVLKVISSTVQFTLQSIFSFTSSLHDSFFLVTLPSMMFFVVVVVFSLPTITFLMVPS